MKPCTKCGLVKDDDGFSIYHNVIKGEYVTKRRAICKKCVYEWQKNRKKIITK